MKIAVWHNLPSGGGKRALYEHVRGLVERGHHIESWCPSTADRTYLPLSSHVVEHVLPVDMEGLRRRALRRATLSRRHAVGRLWSEYHGRVDQIAEMDRHCRECAAQINEGGFDLLFANSCMFHRAPAIGRYVNMPKALYLQEPYRWLYEAMPNWPWMAREGADSLALSPLEAKRRYADSLKLAGMRIQAREEVRNAKRYDIILVNSLFSRESVLRAYGINSCVCYLGIDTQSFRPQNLPRESFLIGLGAFTAEKNIRLVIESLALLPALRPKLVWVGNTAASYREEMMRLAQSLEVCFEPRTCIADQELLRLLNQAAAMVYAPRLEPFGLAPLEASACATPVIAVAEGGVRETVFDGVNGLLVEHDPQSMANAIARLLQDPAYARKLGNQGRHLIVEKWSRESAIDRLEGRFVEILRTGSGGST